MRVSVGGCGCGCGGGGGDGRNVKEHVRFEGTLVVTANKSVAFGWCAGDDAVVLLRKRFFVFV